MADIPSTRTVIGVSRGGYSDMGLTVLFDLQFADKSSEPFQCGHDVLGKLLGDLRMLGQTAEKIRSTMPGQQVEVVRPYYVTGVGGGFDQRAKQVALRFSTPEGIPIDIAMTEIVARQAIECLGTAIRQAQTTPDQHN